MIEIIDEQIRIEMVALFVCMREKERNKDVSAQCQCWLVPYLQDALYDERKNYKSMYLFIYISTYMCSYIRWDQVTHNNRGKSYLTPHSTPLPDSALPPAEYKSTRLYVLRINYLLLSLSLYISAHVVSSLCLIAMVS